MTFCGRPDDDHVASFGHFCCGWQRLAGECTIALVDDKADRGVSVDKSEQCVPVADLTRRVVRIAEPDEVGRVIDGVVGEEGADAMAVHAAGVGIFAEGRLSDVARGAAEGLCGEIDGLGGAVGDAYFCGE